MASKFKVVVKLGATIPTGQYKNIQPTYEVENILEEGVELIGALKNTMGLLRERIAADELQAKFQILAEKSPNWFYERSGKRYVRVSAFLNWFPREGLAPHKLSQYGARGTIIHAQIARYLDSGLLNWLEPELKLFPELKEEIAILKTGDCKLSLYGFDFPGFCEAFKDDFKWTGEDWMKGEQTVYNDTFMYAGTFDRRCLYKGEPAMVDFKTMTRTPDPETLYKYWKQTAMYIKADLCGCKQMVIVPLLGNKKGFAEPYVSNEVDKFFDLGLKDLRSFKKVYGV